MLLFSWAYVCARSAHQSMWYALHLCKYVYVCILFTRACFVYENAAPFSFFLSCTACTRQCGNTGMAPWYGHNMNNQTILLPFVGLCVRTYRYIVISIQYAIWLRLSTNTLRRYKTNGSHRTERKMENTSNKTEVYAVHKHVTVKIYYTYSISV